MLRITYIFFLLFYGAYLGEQLYNAQCVLLEMLVFIFKPFIVAKQCYVIVYVQAVTFQKLNHWNE